MPPELRRLCLLNQHLFRHRLKRCQAFLQGPGRHRRPIPRSLATVLPRVQVHILCRSKNINLSTHAL